MSITFDTRQFDQALKQYVTLTSKTLAEAINKKAGGVAFKAYAATPKADRAKIAAELGASYEAVIGKRGKPTKKKKLVVQKNSRARAILVAQLRRLGKLETSKNLNELLQAFVTARVNSAGFFRSGWLPAIRRLAGSSAVERRKGRPVGRVKPAQDSLSPTAEIENNATPKDRSKMPKVEAFMVAATQRAFNEETQDMAKYISDKLQKTANKFIPPKNSTK